MAKEEGKLKVSGTTARGREMKPIIRHFETKKQAEEYARWIAGQVWRYCSRIERDESGYWVLSMYELPS